jgi:tetratricopeptide (TPR) repeat protein
MVLKARRGAFDSAGAWIVLALAAVFAARAVEQVVGKAQVADLTLMWMLAGVVVAMPAVLTAPVRTAAPEPAAPARRRVDRRRDQQTRRLVPTRLSPVRLGIVGVLVVVALPFWWMAVVQPAQASMAVASGLNAGSEGNQTEALRSMERAIDLSGGAEYAHWYVASGWLETSKAHDDPAEEERALRLADTAIQGAFARDPLNWRPRMLSGVITRRLAVLEPSLKQEAIHDYELVVELLPAFWEQWEQLAWTLTTVGEHERALEVVEHAKDLGGRDNDAAYFLYYVEGKAHKALGHDDEVARILSVLESIDNPLTEPLIADLESPG